MILCLCEIGWLYSKIEVFVNQMTQSPTTDVLNLNIQYTSGGSDLFRGVIAQAFAYAIQVLLCYVEKSIVVIACAHSFCE